MYLKLRILVLILLSVRWLPAQNPDQVKIYINNYKFLAIAEEQRSGIPASIILAQGIHETQAGTSDLVLASNNHFGIKCKDNWTGEVVYHDDDARGECFRSYPAAAESYKDHSEFLRHSQRYAFLFNINPEDYSSWAYGLKKAGYATNNRYPQILIKLIEEYDLQRYSLIALGKIPADQPAEGTYANDIKHESFLGSHDALNEKSFVQTIYPEGLFTINATKVLYAKAGVSLLSLSNQFEIPLAHLLEFNDMHQEDILNNDQLIFIQRKRKSGSTPLHIVQPGESMYSICQSEGIRYESILENNRLKPGEEPAPGEKLYLQTISDNKPILRNSGNVKTTIPSS